MFFKKKAAGRKTEEPSGRLVFSFTASGLLVAYLEGPADRPRVRNFLRLQTDCTQPDPDRDKALKEYLLRLDFKSVPPVTAVASDGVSFRQLTLPSMPDADLKQAVLWEMKKKFFVNPDEQQAGMACVREFEGEEGPEKIISVFYADKKTTLSRLSVITTLGLPLQAFWPGPAALCRLACLQSSKDDGDSLILDMEGTQARVCIAQRETAMLSRTVPIAGAAASPEKTYERVAEEVQKSIEFYETQRDARPVSAVWLAGGGADAAEFAKFLTARLSLNVAPLDGARHVSDALTDEQRDLVTAQPGIFAEALGAAGLAGESLNLLPDEVRALNRRRQLDLATRRFFLGATAALAFWAAWVGVQGQLLAAQAGFVNREWKEIQAGKAAFSNVVSREKINRTAMKGTIDLPALLKELSRLTPPLITVHSIAYSRQEETFELTGVVNDIGNENVKLVTQYVTNLNASPFFKSVTLGQTMEEGKDGKVRFQADGVVRSYA